MSKGIVRTTSFRLLPDHFGTVHLYRPGERFRRVWDRLNDACARTEYRQLPYGGLVTALRVLSGDFVTLRINKRDGWLLISRRPLTFELRQSAFHAWEYAIWPATASGALADAADDLAHQQVEVWSAVKTRKDGCPNADSWVWDVAAWDVAHRLSTAPLQLNDGLDAPLRIDTDAGLVTWDNPVTKSGRINLLSALHRIEPRLITVPGLTVPVLNFESSFVRLADSWIGVKSAWIDRGADRPLLAVPVRARKVDGGWRSIFDDASTDVLKRLDLARIAEPEEINLGNSQVVRARKSSAPAHFPIGTGPGQMFHEAVALHVCRLVPDMEPVQLTRARPWLSRPNQDELRHDDVHAAARGLRGKRLRIVCLYASDDTRARMLVAVKPLFPSLGAKVEDNLVYTEGALELMFRCPSGSDPTLTQLGSANQIRSWIESVVSSWDDNIETAALIETVFEGGRDGDGDDPKFIVRDALARRDIVTQFLSPSSVPRPRRGEKPVDHAANRAVWDLLRSAGAFPRVFPAGQLPPGTWLIGAHVVKRSMTGANAYRRGFVVSLVALEAGGRDARAYGSDNRWMPIGKATAAFHASPHDLAWDDVAPTIDAALSSFVAAFPKRSFVLFMEANGCRRFFSALNDTGGDAKPIVLRTDRVALMRVRSDGHEVPRPAGIGAWPTGRGPAKPRTTNALLRLDKPDYEGAQYYVKTPRNMSRQGLHREHTRFSAALEDSSSLGDNWQALNATEFYCIDSGPFERDALYELSALLCREAPTWDGTLDLPSPCHLAKAIVEDHPGRYLAEGVVTRPRIAGEAGEARLLASL